MSGRYIYDGALGSKVVEHIENIFERYSYVVEISRMPEFDKFEKAFEDESYTVNGETCMGQAYTEERQGISYCIVKKDFSSGDEEAFLFLKTKDIYNKFIERFPEVVINKSPFKTVIGETESKTLWDRAFKSW